jgi:hypothetical protein
MTYNFMINEYPHSYSNECNELQISALLIYKYLLTLF